MKKSISSKPDSKVSEKILSDVSDDIIQLEEPKNVLMDEETQLPALGGEGDQGRLSGSSSHSDIVKADVPASPGPTGQRSKIPRASQKKKRTQSVMKKKVTKKNDPGNEIDTLWGKELSGIGLGNLAERKSSTILDCVTSSEDVLAEYNENLAKKDAEIASLSQLSLKQESQIASMTGRLKELEEKVNANASKKSKELDKLRADLEKFYKSQKQWVQKEKDMLKQIANLEMTVTAAEEREKVLMEKEKEMARIIADFEKSAQEDSVDSEMFRAVQRELDVANHELRCARAELEARQEIVDKNEYYEKKYLKKYNKLITEERTLTKEKFEDLKLWEDELKLREECFERNIVVKEMRDTLMGLLEKKPEVVPKTEEPKRSKLTAKSKI